MIPIQIGPSSGTSFGSSDELKRIEVYSKAGYKNFKNFYSRNPKLHGNDDFFVKLISIVSRLDSHGFSPNDMQSAVSESLDLVYRTSKQELHDTHLGKLLVIPVYEDKGELFDVIYSNSTNLNYDLESIISTVSFVTINIAVLAERLRKVVFDGLDASRFIMTNITIPMMYKINSHAIFNTITSLDTFTPKGTSSPPFYIFNLEKYVAKFTKRLGKVVTNLDTMPLDAIANMPSEDKISFVRIDDMYVGNLLWINLFAYHNIIRKCGNINRESLYNKYWKTFMLYEPRGRGDSYFSVASSELLDVLEDEKFI